MSIIRPSTKLVLSSMWAFTGFLGTAVLGGFFIDVYVTNLAVYRLVTIEPVLKHYVAFTMYAVTSLTGLWIAVKSWHEL